MKIKTEKFELIEIMIEDKSYEVVNEAIKDFRKQGFSASNPTTHYGKQGREEDKMWWSKITKKTPVFKTANDLGYKKLEG